jgi:hypothetical protein
MNNYQVWLGDGTGRRRKPLVPDAIDFARVANDVGSLTLTVPLDFNTNLLGRDSWIEVWRRTRRGRVRLEGHTVWLLNKWTEIYQKGAKKLQLDASCLNSLADSRIVAYTSGTAYADKTGAADAVAIALVRENLGDLAQDFGRQISAQYFSVPTPPALGAPSITESLARKTLKDALKAVASNSESQGRKLFWDFRYAGTQRVEFAVYLDQLGVDLTSARLRFDPAAGNLSNVRITVDYSAERNFIYALGQGAGGNRTVVTAQDNDSITSSTFGRKEISVDGRSNTGSTALQNDANTALAKYKPRIYLEGTIEDTPSMSYGDDWYFGDKVKVVASNHTFICNINGVNVKMDGGKEKIQAKIKGELT